MGVAKKGAGNWELTHKIQSSADNFSLISKRFTRCLFLITNAYF